MKTVTYVTIAIALMLLVALPAWTQTRQARQGGDARVALQDCPLAQEGTCTQDCLQQNLGICDQQCVGQCTGGGRMGQGRGRQMGRGGQGRRGQGGGLCGMGLCLSEEIVPLTEAEIGYVLTMREEEKLARDVYLKLNADLSSVVFERIATSEQNHMNAIARIIAIQGLVDPVVDDTAGAFTSTDPDFATLYASLVAQGSAGYVEALMVGAYIEELDIEDLQAALAVVTNPQVKRVFENLLYGSYNHLRAFVASLEAEGETYVPQVLDGDNFDEIISSAPVKGRGLQGQCTGAQGTCTGDPTQCPATQTQTQGTARQGR